MAYSPPPPPPPKRPPGHQVLSNQRPWEVIVGDSLDVLRAMPPKCVQTVVTSPPYWAQRDYNAEGQLGQEETPDAFTVALSEVMSAVKRVLRDDGTLWLNLGDSYVNKSRVGVPWRVALNMKARGWTLRNEIIWHKTKIMPDWVQDRLTRNHEQLFLFTKGIDYFYDGYPLRIPSKTDRMLKGRNKRTVWPLPTSVYKGAHFATFPVQLVDPCIQAGTSAHGACSECGTPWTRVIERVGEAPKSMPRNKDKGATGRGDLASRNEAGHLDWRDLGPVSNPGRWCPEWRHVGWEPGCKHNAKRVPCVVLDPFLGSGTTLVGATRLLRRGIGIELNPDNAKLARDRIYNDFPLGSIGL